MASIETLEQQVLTQYQKIDYTTRVMILEKMREARNAQKKIEKLEYKRNAALRYVEMSLLVEQTSVSIDDVNLRTEEPEWDGYCDECSDPINQYSGWKCRLCRKAFCYDTSCEDCDCLTKLDDNFPALLSVCTHK